MTETICPPHDMVKIRFERACPADCSYFTDPDIFQHSHEGIRWFCNNDDCWRNDRALAHLCIKREHRLGDATHECIDCGMTNEYIRFNHEKEIPHHFVKMPSEADRYFGALMEKFYRVAREKGRSLEPWKAYTPDFLLSRLMEEVEELRQAATGIENLDAIRDELKDVGAFAMFLYLALDGGKQ